MPRFCDADTDTHATEQVHVPLEKCCVAQLARVCAAATAVVVLSTTLRLDAAMRAFLVSTLAGVGVTVVGDTPVASER